MSGLVRVGQDDFGAGMLRGLAPDVQPGVGLANATNGFFNDDGDVYRRGGSGYFSATAPAGLTFIWTGYLNNQPRILLATTTGFYTLASFVPPAAAMVSLGGAGIVAPVLPAIVGNKVFLPNATKWDGGAAVAPWVVPASLPVGTRHVCAAAGRLLVAAGNRVAFSVADAPETFVADDFHDLPGGVLVMGMTAIRDTAFVFTNYGLWTISNLAFDLTDSLGNIQQQLQLITPELSLWHESGLASWSGRIVAPCANRVFLVDGINAPVPITDSIGAVYLDLVKAGYRPGGGKVYRSHYFMPVLDAGGAIQQMLACRMDRPVRGRGGVYYPWSIVTGHAQNVKMADFALVGTSPRFLGAHADGRVCDLTALLDPSETTRSDADGTVQPFDIETRDFPTGQGQPNHVRALRLRYTVKGAGHILAAISVGSQAQRYEDVLPRTYAQVFTEYANYNELWRGGAVSGLPPSAGDVDRYWYLLGSAVLPEPGVEPVSWRLPTAKRTRYIRARFRCEDAVTQLVLHHMDFSVRQSTHDR